MSENIEVFTDEDRTKLRKFWERGTGSPILRCPVGPNTTIAPVGFVRLPVFARAADTEPTMERTALLLTCIQCGCLVTMEARPGNPFPDL